MDPSLEPSKLGVVGIEAVADEGRKLAPGPFLDSINSAVVQSFFCHRAYLLIRRQLWLPIIVGVSYASTTDR
jgi:hypothetical protein